MVPEIKFVHEIKYDEVNEVAVLIFKDNYLHAEVEPVSNKVKELLVGKPYKQVVIVMDSRFTIENREAREAATRSFSEASEVAFVGGGAINRMITKVMFKTGIIKMDGEFFKTYEDAIVWLKSRRN